MAEDDKHDAGRAAAEVVGTQIVMSTHHEERIRDLEVDVAVHGRALEDLKDTTEGLREDLKTIATKLTTAVENLADRVERFERILIIAGVVIFASTSHGAQILNWVGTLFK